MAPPTPAAPLDAHEASMGLARGLGLSLITARLLLARGQASEAEARAFLDPRLAQLRAPELPGAAMAGFTRAADRLAQAVRTGETIGVFGDYDADGVTTAALLGGFLRDAGAKVVARVAHRDDGYGFSPAMADRFADQGCRLLVTCDCGTSDHPALERARQRGVAVVIVDHHQVPEREPAALALINPHQVDCRFPFKGLASVGVGFYLAAAVRTRLRSQGHPCRDPRELLDLVALGTIADLVPLVEENRVLVAAGLRALARAARPGLRALMEAQGLLAPGLPAPRPVSAADVSFKLAPVLNAPGRLGEAQLALDLLLERDPARAAALAQACLEQNQRRREIQDQVFVEACAQIDAAPSRAAAAEHAIVVAGEGWHHGVVGIVAAKLVDRYRRPAVVIGLSGGHGRGSARVPLGSRLHLYRALSACAEHLGRHGGHAAAAGLSIERGALAAFARDFDRQAAHAGDAAGRPAVVPELEVDLEVVDEALVAELERLGPFGMGNPEPVLAVRRAAVERSRIVGDGHLMLTLRQGIEERDGIAFGQGGRDPGRGAWVSAAFVPEIDSYRGVRRLRLRVLHVEEQAPGVDASDGSALAQAAL